jgi:acetylornithine deacetylase/succinyl-diaminopimelate desuccinylase-like protein
VTDIASRWVNDVLASLSGLIEIPAVSPAYDPNWFEKDYLLEAAEHLRDWIAAHDGLTAEIIQLPGRTPLVFAEAPGRIDRGTVVIYGHLDKLPRLGDWSPGLDPWRAVVRDGRLYGRGAADDGYAGYAAVTALAASRTHARTVILLETSEESGSPDLDTYLTAIEDRLGDVSLVIGLDSAGLDYERLWLTTSLQGEVQATVTVRVMHTPPHSEHANGTVPNSSRIMRQLLDRVQDSATGVVTIDEMNTPIPDTRWDDAKRTSAGAVLRSETTSRLCLRTPPTVDVTVAAKAVIRILTTDVPYGASVEVRDFITLDGWEVPPAAGWLTAALDQIGEQVFGMPCATVGMGRGIPSLGMLAQRYPAAQFLVTGAVGPDSNIHALDESLNLAYAYRLTEAIALVLAAGGKR